MPIVCPHCQQSMSVKIPKPGRYTPKCSRCGRTFTLTVSDDGRSAKAAPLDGTAKPNPPPPAPAAPEATVVGDASGADDVRFSLAPPADATAANSGPPPEAVPGKQSDDSIPATLGGYQILKRLGKGGMGAVYLARQVSLDRLVALKVMNPQWAENPAFMARFTREAYAAAQLVHHNVVQVYDIGEDRGINYFSMEYVEGESLHELLKKDGKLDCEVAAGYVLQAARGLKFAHDRGMIHRDVKPDNLLLNTEGIVKVADLGLVRTPGAAEAPAPLPAAPAGPGNITLANQAMGTPAFMSPEQARDATRVDHRADIYSLGCTLYVLVSGRTPFSGSTAMEVMSKHAFEPLVPPEAVVHRVPKQLSAIVVKMMAKKPEDRYPHMGEVVKALEDFLGVQSAGRFSPREEHARALEKALKRFNQAPGAAARNWIFPSFLGGCAVLFLLLAVAGKWLPAGGFLGLGVLTAVASFLIDGVLNRSHLFQKTREHLLESSWSDWLTWGGCLLLVLLVLWLLGLFWVWLGVVIVAVGLAVGFHFLIDRPLAERRREPLAAMNKLLRELRRKGLDEESLRQFVCKYSGDRWEEFYETLFGYEAKLEARTRWGKGLTGQPREKFAAWRDPIVRALDARRKARQETHEREHLRQVEAASLQAQGLSVDAARQKAEQTVDDLVQAAAQVKEEPKPLPVATPATVPEDIEALAREKANEEILRRRVEALLRAADEEEVQQAPPVRRPAASFSRTAEPVFAVFLGVRPRLLLGLVLLCGFLFWLHTHQLMPGANPDVNLSNWSRVWEMLQENTGVLDVPLIAPAFTAPFASVNAGVAGLMLVLSVLVGGNRIGLFLMPAAVLMVLGPQLGVPHLVSLAAGGVLVLIGLLVEHLSTQSLFQKSPLSPASGERGRG